MARIYLEVLFAGNGTKYEFSLDDRTTVEQAKKRMMDEICNLEDAELFFAPEKTLLCSYSQRQQLDDGLTVRGAGVESGDLLMLV